MRAAAALVLVGALFAAFSTATLANVARAQENGTSSANAAAPDPLAEAAESAEQVAKSAGLRYALANAWQVIWGKSWPFLKSMATGFLGLFSQAWKSASMQPAANQPVNASTNAPATNAAQ